MIPLIHFWLIFPFNTPFGFLVFSGVFRVCKMGALTKNGLIFSACILSIGILSNLSFRSMLFCLCYQHYCKLCKSSEWIIFLYYFPKLESLVCMCVCVWGGGEGGRGGGGCTKSVARKGK